jgi:hypothetical protein
VSEPKGRGAAWTPPASQRGAVPPGPRSEGDEGRRHLKSAPEASGDDRASGRQSERKRRIGVYVCRCGGNISDYVDVQRVVDAVSGEDDVVVVRQAMFTCSDATQAEIEADITGQHLDGLVVASSRRSCTS